MKRINWPQLAGTATLAGMVLSLLATAAPSGMAGTAVENQPATVTAQSTSPRPAPEAATPAIDQVAQRLLALWNQDGPRDAALQTVFADELIARRGRDRLLQMLNELYQNEGTLKLLQISQTGPHAGALVVQGSKGNQLQIRLDYTPEQKIAAVGIQLLAAAPNAEEKNLDQAAISTKLASLMADLNSKNRFSGSVILARHGKPLFAHAYGLAERAEAGKAARDNTLDTPFNLASMNKMFTGVAINQLLAQGKLKANDKVGQYLPDYPNATVREQVTIHQLLTHTAGLGNYWNERFQQQKKQLRSLQDFAALFADQPLEFAPGSRYQYSNAGPVVLGLILEKVSGQSYYDYVRQHIYQVAEMKNSDHYPLEESASGKAIGYFSEPGKAQQSNQAMMGRIGSAAGGGYASANDLLRFANALESGRLLPDAQKAVMTRAQTKTRDEDLEYGYLFGVQSMNGKRYFGHNGGSPGVASEFSVFPESGYTVIVLSNVEEDARIVARKLRQWIAFGRD